MRTTLLGALLAVAGAASTSHAQSWVLERSTITYLVTHPLHHVIGISHAARGKGVCMKGQCDFLIAVPVNSFDSGDSNRDLHMLQVTRGGEFPMIAVRTSLPQNRTGSVIMADLAVQFAGQTVRYKQVPFQRADHYGETRITGTIPLNISDFKISPPMLLAIPIKDRVPIKVDMTWRMET